MSKSKEDYTGKYTHPKLRERLKEEIKASDKGGAPGQWSARKSQMLTQAYEKHGGGYRNPGRKTSSQRSLEQWSEQQWQTKSGSAHARHDGQTERYLPKQAWEQLSDGQRRETEQRKRNASRRGQQSSSNPPEAKRARKAADLDELPAREAVKQARTFGPQEAQRAVRHERAHKGRKTVISELCNRLDRHG